LIIGDSFLKKHRVSTTISQKHWDLLQKYSEKYETHQRAIEVALESLEYSSNKSQELTPEENLWLRLKRENVVCVFEKNAFKLLIENANIEPLQEIFNKQKLMESSLEYLFQRPLKELSLIEVIEGLVTIGRLVNWLDTVDYKDDGNNYRLVVTHSFGPNVSKIILTAFGSVFKNYGVKADITVSPMTIFMKISKI
jgi:hypothetical protein